MTAVGSDGQPAIATLSEAAWLAGRRQMTNNDTILQAGPVLERAVAKRIAAHPIPDDVRGRRDFPACWAATGFFEYYLAFYALQYIPQTQLRIHGALKRSRATELRVLDIGVGTATTALAISDLASRLAGTELGAAFERLPARYLGIDSCAGLIDYSKSVLREYAVVAEECGHPTAARLASQLSGDDSWTCYRIGADGQGLAQVQTAIRELRPNIVVVENLLAEMDDGSRGALMRFLCEDHIPLKARMILTAPSSPSYSQYFYVDPAINWRNGLLGGGHWRETVRCSSRPNGCADEDCLVCGRRVRTLPFKLPGPLLDASPYQRLSPVAMSWSCELERVR